MISRILVAVGLFFAPVSALAGQDPAPAPAAQAPAAQAPAQPEAAVNQLETIAALEEQEALALGVVL